MRSEATVRVRSREIHLRGTVWGLASEADRVLPAFDDVRPHAVGLGVGPEDLDGLRKLEEGATYEHEYSEADEVYAHFLGQFGEVALPPRDLAAAVRVAQERGVPVVALDFPEVTYVEAFTDAISAWDLLRYNRRVRRVARRPPRVPDALAFHLWWDAHIGRLRGFAALERQREARIAESLLGDAVPDGRILVFVEAARVEGIARALERDAEKAQETAP